MGQKLSEAAEKKMAAKAKKSSQRPQNTLKIN